MTTRSIRKYTVLALFGWLLALPEISFSQTNFLITQVVPNDEQAIRLTWQSVSNEVYEIDEADSLIDTNTGLTTWTMLYNNYPSQGTNTFWLDTGNYNLAPQILHPKNSAMRFYRVVDLGPDTTPDEPIVSITSPTNNYSATGELTITVSAFTDQPVMNGTKLYVDGEEQRPTLITTNWQDSTGVTNYEVDTYTINTCEWGNEIHTLFATAQCQSGTADGLGSAPVETGHAVSPIVSVLFSNLITRIAFSQPSFDPASGQTQEITAAFASNSDWTLNIEDINSNVVFTTNGSGNTMIVDWNGTATSGSNLVNGIYYYYISAATNGGSAEIVGGGGSGGGGSPPSSPEAESRAFGASVETQWWAAPLDGSAAAVPFALYPPGFDTNTLNIFQASSSTDESVKGLSFRSSFSSGGSAFAASASGGSSAASQSSPAAPQRIPANPVVGVSGTFGVAYDTYSANGTNAMTAGPIPDVPGIPGSYISIQGLPSSTNLNWPALLPFAEEAANFSTEMHLFGWEKTLYKVDDQLKIADLQTSSTPFNNVSLGVLLSHGVYGTTQDYREGLSKQMYFPITAGNSITYLRMSDMNLGGGDPTNGLKWFFFMSCFSLHHANWNSMLSAGKEPYNSNMHLILGSDSTIYTSATLLQNFAAYANTGYTNSVPLTIHDAFYLAARNAYHGHSYTNTITMAIAGDSNCTSDYIEQGFNSSPTGTWTYESQQVWP